MNRIYQGRISKVQQIASDGSDLIDLPLECLWKHHCLFQDAVNYYLFCLAALSSDSLSPMGKLRNQLREVWQPFSRKSKRFSGFAQTLEPYLLPNKETISLNEAFEAALAGNTASAELRQLAVDALVEDLSGDAAIQQGGRTYWPMFCNPSSNPTYPRSKTALEREAARDWLPEFLHDPKTSQDLNAAAQRLELRLFANPASGKPEIHRLWVASSYFALLSRACGQME